MGGVARPAVWVWLPAQQHPVLLYGYLPDTRKEGLPQQGHIQPFGDDRTLYLIGFEPTQLHFFKHDGDAQHICIGASDDREYFAFLPI